MDKEKVDVKVEEEVKAEETKTTEETKSKVIKVTIEEEGKEPKVFTGEKLVMGFGTPTVKDGVRGIEGPLVVMGCTRQEVMMLTDAIRERGGVREVCGMGLMGVLLGSVLGDIPEDILKEMAEDDKDNEIAADKGDEGAK